GEPFLREFAGAYGAHQRVPEALHRALVAQPAAHADRVGAGGDGEDDPVFEAVRTGDGAHLHAVGDDQTLVAAFAAQQVGGDAPGDGGRTVRVEDRYPDVGAHDGPGAGRDRRPERLEFALVQRGGVEVDLRERVVGVDAGVAVAGEVL